MIELGALLVFGVAVVSLVLVAGFILKTIFWLVLLPVRLVFWLVGTLLFLPFLLIKAVMGGLMMLIALPLLVVGLVIGAIAFTAAMLIPAIPLLFLVALVWFLVRPERQALARG
jgi:hypothetical protein